MSKEWTEEEIEILKEYYPIGGVRAVKEHLKDRSERGIRKKVERLHISYSPFPEYNSISRKAWTDEEIKILKKYYSKGGIKAAKEYLPDRSEDGIRRKAEKLCIRYSGASKPEKKNYKKWTKKEMDILRKYYPKEGRKVAKRLPGRTEDECAGIAYYRNISKGNYKVPKKNIIRPLPDNQEPKETQESPVNKDNVYKVERELILTRDDLSQISSLLTLLEDNPSNYTSLIRSGLIDKEHIKLLGKKCKMIYYGLKCDEAIIRKDSRDELLSGCRIGRYEEYKPIGF